MSNETPREQPAPVHPDIEKVLEVLASSFSPFESLDPEGARQSMLDMIRARKAPLAEVASTQDRTIPGPAGAIPVRIYQPFEKRTRGATVYFHGGGHVLGDLESHDSLARALCAKSGTALMSVDYRLGPEHRFPAAVEDAVAAVAWAAENASELDADACRLGVAGDSAGANLATVAAIAARDGAGPDIALQVLIYPVADYRQIDDSYRRYATGYGILSAETMRWFRRHYLRSDEDANDWRASPVLAPSLAGLAPAIVITAECDVLRDEGVRYAKALAAAGVPTEHRDYAGMIHGFAPLSHAIASARDAQDWIARALIDALG